MKNRTDYTEKMKDQLDAMNKAMHEMEDKFAAAKGEASDSYKKALRDMRAQSILAGDKVKELQTTGEKSWDAGVEHMEKLRDAFTHSLHYFKSQI